MVSVTSSIWRTSDACAIRVTGLNKSFGPKHVLRGVDLEIPMGAITAIIGKSGEGKSVLLKCISGLLQADSGTIDVACEGARNGNRAMPGVSYMFQNNALFDSMTAYENVALPLRERTRMKRREIDQRVQDLFERLDLGPVGSQYPADLSGGMQKRVALARALVFNPEIVLFDEPTAGLDPLRKNAVMTMIEHYQRVFGYTAVMVSHDLPDVLYFSHHVAALQDGVIKFSGTPLELEQRRSELTEGFLNSRDDLRHELSGLRNMKQLEADLPRLKRDGRGFAMFEITQFRDIETELGELAAHLIESTLVRLHRAEPEFAETYGYSLGPGKFLLVLNEPVEEVPEKAKILFESFRRYLNRLKTDRCVAFAVRALPLPAKSVPNVTTLLTTLSARGQTVFTHECR